MTLTQVTKAGLNDIALDHVFTIGASGTDHYTFQGEGLNGTVNDPTLYLTRGKTYRFENGTGAHAIRIQSADDGTSGTLYNTGVTNNNTTGTVIVEVQHDAPDVLYYQCAAHANMKGTIYITGALSDGSVTTAKLADSTGSSDGVTTAKLADDAVTADKLANSINSAIAANTAKDLTALSASNLTSGTVPDARISASSVTQHVTAFDDNTIINDISALALKLNALQNATRYNTNSTYVDTFQDSNGIATFTGTTRDATNEYVSAFAAESFGTLVTMVAANWNIGNLGAKTAGTGTLNHGASPDEDGMMQTMGASSEITFPANTPFQFDLVQANVNNRGPYINIQLTSNSDTGTPANTTNFKTNGRRTANSIYINADRMGAGLDFRQYDNSGTETYIVNGGNDMAWGGQTQIQRDTSGIFRLYRDYVLQGTTTHAITGQMQIAWGGTGGNACSATSVRYAIGTPALSGPTGSFISNAVTASASTTSMGAVVTYIDQAGTATLNTDLKISLSADNGSTFTQGTLVAQPDFATGVKMAKVNDVTVTAGTQLKYKVEFANQSASKETRVTGVSLQY